jgi:hypothetical protein
MAKKKTGRSQAAARATKTTHNKTTVTTTTKATETIFFILAFWGGMQIRPGLSGVRAGLPVTSRLFLHSHAEKRTDNRQSRLTPTAAFRPTRQ